MSNKSTRFKKGQSGNPSGRPKRAWTWAGLMEKYAEEMVKGEKGKVKDKVVQKVFELAKRGDMTAAKELFNRMDGMPKQSTDLHIKELPKPLLTNVHNNDGAEEAPETQEEN